jgi:hypothetical protein
MTRRNLDDLAGFNSDLDSLEQGGGLGILVTQRDHTEITTGSDTELSTDESLELERCEAIIERGLQTFYDVGSALLRVRDLRLYRVEYGTFEEYCAERWSISRPRAYQFIDAAEVRSNLSTMVDIEPPVSERQTRPLTRLSPDQQRQAWQSAVERAKETGKRITAALVEAVVKELQPLTPPEAEQPEAIPAQAAVRPAPAAEDDDDEYDDEEAELRGEWPDDMEDLTATLHRRGYVLIKETDARLTYQRDSDQAVITVARPPERGTLKVRVVAHRDEDWEDVADQLALAGVELDRPREGHLPKYPETQRAYGTLKLSRVELDQVGKLQQQVEQWKQRHETQRQALEAMRGRAVQAETQLEVEQHKVQQLQDELQQLREGQ